ncbi:putative Stage II sporulation protein M [[Clostridium] ultunense Esp]|uniref:stage II sporulation protein M n=1 Tax=Thermicanus aegyptius TaxID=94009 RepID=UPI0002B705A9|nr:stage II sporulation protein M [Thermicanus aegyptius]CCQ95618.1 putative Stage II sporulation protein M [[Clostridium] ultunense Esp]
MERVGILSRFILYLYMAGFIFGVLFALLLPKEQAGSLHDYLSHFFADFSQDQTVHGEAALFSLLFHHGKWILLFFLLGISVLGSPLLLLFLFIKGTLLGFTFSTLLLLFKEKGVLFFLYSVLPQNLLLLPLYMLMAAMGLSVSLYLFLNRILSAQGKLQPILLRFLYFTVISFVLAALISWYEKTIALTLMEQSLYLMGF